MVYRNCISTFSEESLKLSLPAFRSTPLRVEGSTPLILPDKEDGGSHDSSTSCKKEKKNEKRRKKRFANFLCPPSLTSFYIFGLIQSFKGHGTNFQGLSKWLCLKLKSYLAPTLAYYIIVSCRGRGWKNSMLTRCCPYYPR